MRQRNLKKEKAIEVGNIFPLKDNYAKEFDLAFKDKNGQEKLVSAGCYGLGISRLMAAVVEVNNDEKGIIWPESIAPFKAHLINLKDDKRKSAELYDALQKNGVEVLYDDREEATAGEKFSDADLIGIPYRLVVSEKTGDKIEIKNRIEEKGSLVSEEELLKVLI